MKAAKEHKPQQSRVIQNKIIQCKPDHLFNDIPSAFSRDIPKQYIENLAEIKEELNKMRNTPAYIPMDVYQEGVIDDNNQKYSNALQMFRNVLNYPFHRASVIYPVVSDLFNNSIDPKVKHYLLQGEFKQKKSSLQIDLDKWLKFKPNVAMAINEVDRS